MPETTKTFADMEILQGADYDMTLTLDSPTRYYNNQGVLIDDAGKSYMVTISKDFTGATDFGGRTDGDGTPSNPYRMQITETDVANRGKLTASDASTVYTVSIKLYAEWTESLDDGFDGKWEMVEKDATSYTRIAQGDIYVDNSVSRWDTTRTLAG